MKLETEIKSIVVVRKALIGKTGELLNRPAHELSI